ncbi:hypothetical protein ABIA30_000318 [Mycobacterium sp. MAA66]|jgi:hypothetical protein|uniref:AhpC/TSA family protein n=1 Tax=Mycobacterium sp. MAA66 TaxID=3156297 RepID=UPI003519BDCB
MSTSLVRLAADVRRHAVGDVVDPQQWTTLAGMSCHVPDSELLLHIQFRRFAGCPICNTHLREVTLRGDELAAAGIREVIVFHSSADELLRYQPDIPFDVVADPDKVLYRQFGVETSWRSLCNPRLWLRFAAVAATMWRTVRTTRRLQLRPTGGELGQPADLLLNTRGEVVAVKYGRHAYDQWSVDEVLTLAGEFRRSS